MNVYRIDYEHESYVVEAPTFGTAVKAFKEDLRAKDNDVDGNAEPTSVTLISEYPVIDCAKKAEKEN